MGAYLLGRRGRHAAKRAERWHVPVALPVRWQFQVELPAVLTVTFVLLFLVSWGPVERALPGEEMYRLLGIAAAAAAAMAAIAATVAAHETAEATMRMVATALAFYGLVVMPLSVTRTSAAAPFWLHGALAGASVAFLCLMALTLSQRHASWAAGWRGVLAGVGLTVLLATLTAHSAVVAAVLTNSRLPNGAVLAGWCVLAAVFVTRGVLVGDAVIWRIGLGVGVIAIAHLLRAAGEGAVASPDVPFFTLRLLGLLVLLGALAVYARRVSLDRRQKHTEEYQRLRSAALAAERAAEQSRERDHEMRNVLAGISGAAHLLGTGTPAVGFDLTAAVTAELNRLSALLEHPSDPEMVRSTPVPDLLTRLVMLRRASGADIELVVGESLRVAMPPEPLAQVVSNLLVNCDRYAPGASVRVRAWQDGDVGRIEVADSGPGIADGGAAPVARSGSGIGLVVSSRLLTEHGGSLRLLPTPHGCTALVEVPVASTISSTVAERRGALIPGVA